MRKFIATLAASAAIVVAGFASPAFAQEEEKNIVEIANANPDFKTLVAAVTAANLAETLSGEGPFTVFAPTEAAFAKLPAGTVEELLKDPEGALADILKLHVIAGAVDAKGATAAAGTNVKSLGGPIAVALDGDKLTVGGATVVTADIKASNGIIHVIDTVITAPAADAPSAVETGESGLAATNSNNALLLVLGGVAIVGLGSSSVALARRRN